MQEKQIIIFGLKENLIQVPIDNLKGYAVVTIPHSLHFI